MNKYIILLMAIAAVASEEVTRNETKAVLPEPRNALKFEDQPDTPQSYGLIRFEGNNEQYGIYNGVDKDHGQRIRFDLEEDNQIENQRPNHQKKKRRRRKPKQRFPNIQGGGLPSPVGSGPVFQGGYPGPIYHGQRPYSQPPYPGQFYKPRPSPTSAALSAVTEALTSIALYDDRQCVPRLLCEAAGGAGAGVAGAGGLLQAVSGMQPLLTLLAAYNGISSSPLFVFGRAVFLGMTSKANPGTCRYAYPDCPNDPEQLVHYLNNHNGGFFRFFAAPQQNQQQGLEQFYNQLSGQINGHYQPQNLQKPGYAQLQQQNYQNLQQFGQIQQGYLNQNQQGPYHQQNSQSSNLQQFGQVQQGYPNQNQQDPYHYGLFQQQNFGNFQNNGHQRPSLYGNGYGYYGSGYPYQVINNNRFKNNDIQKRIQNTGSVFTSNNNAGTKWQFPEDSRVHDKEIYSNVRLGKVFKFPQSNVNSIKAADGFIFPGVQSNRDYIINNIEAEADNSFKFDNPTAVNNYRLVNEQYVKGNNYFGNDDVRTLYIVRGNGDPNHPEIVHLAPGQTL